VWVGGCGYVCVHAHVKGLETHAHTHTHTHNHAQGWCNTRLHCAAGSKVIVAGHENAWPCMCKCRVREGGGRCNMDHVTFCKIMADVFGN